MVPMEVFALKHEGGDDGEDGERDYFLYDLELHQRIGSAIADEAQFVGWHLQGILEESDAPREYDDEPQGPTAGDVHLLKFQVSVPREGHEHIAANEQQNGVKSVHYDCLF